MSKGKPLKRAGASSASAAPAYARRAADLSNSYSRDAFFSMDSLSILSLEPSIGSAVRSVQTRLKGRQQR